MAAYSLLPRLGEARRTTNIPRKVTLVESNGASGVSSYTGRENIQQDPRRKGALGITYIHRLSVVLELYAAWHGSRPARETDGNIVEY